MREFVGGVYALFFGIAIFGLVIFGGWKAGWWFRAQDAQLNGQVNQSSYGYQESHKDQLANLITTTRTIDVQLTETQDPNQQTALKGQRQAIVTEACRTADQITTLPTDEAAWRGQNCGRP